MNKKVKFEEKRVFIKTGKSTDFSIPEKFYNQLWKNQKGKSHEKNNSNKWKW